MIEPFIQELRDISIFLQNSLVNEIRHYPHFIPPDSSFPQSNVKFWKSQPPQDSKNPPLMYFTQRYADLGSFTYSFFVAYVVDYYSRLTHQSFSSAISRILHLLDSITSFCKSQDFYFLESYHCQDKPNPRDLYQYIYLSVIDSYYNSFIIPSSKYLFLHHYELIPDNFIFRSPNPEIYSSFDYSCSLQTSVVFAWHYAIAQAILQNIKTLPSTLGSKKASIDQAESFFKIPHNTAITVYHNLLYMRNPKVSRQWDINYAFRQNYFSTRHLDYKSIVYHLIQAYPPAVQYLANLTD